MSDDEKTKRELLAEVQMLRRALADRQEEKFDPSAVGGIAQDFNQLLTIICGCSDIVFHALPSDQPIREFVTRIRKAGEKAASLTRQLSAMSRKIGPEESKAPNTKNPGILAPESGTRRPLEAGKSSETS
jgi:site-specific recombinase XerC